ncbi:zinc transporter 5 [Achlya hypogyna]|uniref:Zinc transporter 5 n=1 Tax=Achlya hypogyna TaxID=1202772 RepID=A0A1V9ZNS9_ACHHY|nr:zinc transporter 5 [Achlya hypogyna]
MLAPDDDDDMLVAWPRKPSMGQHSLVLAATSAGAQLAWIAILYRAVATASDLATAFAWLPTLFAAGGLAIAVSKPPSSIKFTPGAAVQGVILCVLFLLRMHMLHYCGVAFTALVETAHLCLTPRDVYPLHSNTKAVVAIAGGYTLALAFTLAASHPPSLLFHLILCIASMGLHHAHTHLQTHRARSSSGIVACASGAAAALVSSLLFSTYLAPQDALPRPEAGSLSPGTMAVVLTIVGVLALPALVPHWVGDSREHPQAKLNAVSRLLLQVPVTLATYVATDLSLHAIIHAMLSLGALVCIIWGLTVQAPLRLPSAQGLDPAARTILLFLVCNVAYMVVEFVVGYWTNSLGLWSDAGHMLFDNLSLVIGLCAATAAKWPASAMYPFGYARVEVLSGFVNGILLVLMAVHFMTEALSRATAPPEVHTDHLLLTSVGGLVMNIVGLVWFHDLAHGHSHGHDGHCANSNLVGVYLHVLADTLGSIGVIVSSVCIDQFGWLIMDPLCSALISVLVFASTLPLLRDTALELVQGLQPPSTTALDRAAQAIEALPGVAWVDGVRGWRQGHAGLVVTAHVGVVDHVDRDSLLSAVHATVRRHVNGVVEATIELKTHSIPVEHIEKPVEASGCCHGHGHGHGHSHQ